MAGDSPQQVGGLAAGSQVAAYRIEGQAGAGGMAVVYRARDERLGRTVALKVLAPALAADAGFRQRFIRESQAAAAVDDPHIIPVYEAGEADGVLFIAMRYVSGGDLRSLAAREGPLSAERAAGFVSAAASALDAAHAAGLVHRDVKPANMLVDTRPGRPDHLYLSDFGLTKGAMWSAASLTGTGGFFGTADYCSPEQANGDQVDGRADQYALACVAFSLLAGAPMFERDQPVAVLHAHLSQPPPSLTRRRPDLPAAADQVLARALAKAPADRYPTCGEFAAALRDALGLPPYAPASAPGHHPADALLREGAGPGQAALPAGGTDHPRTQTLTTGGTGPSQPDAPAHHPDLAAAAPGGNPITAAITAPAAHLVGYGQQPARKRLLGPGRRRAVGGAAILLAICLVAFAVTSALAAMPGTHKPPAAAGHKPPAVTGRKPAPSRQTSAPPPTQNILLPTTAPSTAPSPSAPPAPSPSAPPAPSPELTSTCTFGYYGNGTFLPATQANASAGYPSAVKVTYTGDGPGAATLYGFQITVTYQGQVTNQQNATSAAPDLPALIEPGEMYTAVILTSNLPGSVYVSTATYLGSQCSAATWFNSP